MYLYRYFKAIFKIQLKFKYLDEVGQTIINLHPLEKKKTLDFYLLRGHRILKVSGYLLVNPFKYYYILVKPLAF